MSEYQVTGCGTRLRSPLRSLLRKQRLLVGSLTVNGRITHTHMLRVCVMLCLPCRALLRWQRRPLRGTGRQLRYAESG